jgi:hypothetical protein
VGAASPLKFHLILLATDAHAHIPPDLGIPAPVADAWETTRTGEVDMIRDRFGE